MEPHRSSTRATLGEVGRERPRNSGVYFFFPIRCGYNKQKKKKERQKDKEVATANLGIEQCIPVYTGVHPLLPGAKTNPTMQFQKQIVLSFFVLPRYT